MDLSPETKASTGSAVRVLVPLVLGAVGATVSTTQTEQIIALVTAVAWFGISLWWSRRSDEKVVELSDKPKQ